MGHAAAAAVSENKYSRNMKWRTITINTKKSSEC
jgi:hypothetical protein